MKPQDFIDKLYENMSEEMAACIVSGVETITESVPTKDGGVKTVIKTKNPVSIIRNENGEITEVKELTNLGD